MFRFRFTVRSLMPLFAAFFALFCALPSWGQVTTGRLKVVVTDNSEFELPIPESTVTLTGSSLIGGKQERLSDANGEVVFVELLPGSYDVAVSSAGFTGVTVRGIRVDVNRTNLQQIKLPLEGSSAEIEVIAKTVQAAKAK